jgi:hypothetical protein
VRSHLYFTEWTTERNGHCDRERQTPLASQFVHMKEIFRRVRRAAVYDVALAFHSLENQKVPSFPAGGAGVHLVGHFEAIFGDWFV